MYNKSIFGDLNAWIQCFYLHRKFSKLCKQSQIDYQVMVQIMTNSNKSKLVLSSSQDAKHPVNRGYFVLSHSELDQDANICQQHTANKQLKACYLANINKTRYLRVRIHSHIQKYTQGSAALVPSPFGTCLASRVSQKRIVTFQIFKVTPKFTRWRVKWTSWKLNVSWVGQQTKIEFFLAAPGCCFFA